ncbi:metallophosphoesterase family protein [bacterium]|nr:metallophosphoesterase family protein [bacterium]
MKVAVISDIHANLVALQEVLKDIAREGCEKVICLGDLVLAGPQPKETIDFFKQQNWLVIQGNTDKLIVDFGTEVLEMLQERFPIMAKAIVDDIALLEDDDIAYLNNLPPQVMLEVGGLNLHLVHGSPRANNEDIMPGLPIETVEEIIADTDADLILCGHTHTPCGYQTNKKQTVVNVGSVGRPMTPTPLACYAVLDIEDGKFSIKHKFVDYDREFAAQLVREREFEGADQLAELIINPVVRHV